MSTASDAAPVRVPFARRRFLSFVLPVGLLILWELTARTGTAPEYLSSPSSIARSFVQMWVDGLLWGNVAASLWRVFGGFVIGVTLGILIGLLAGVSRMAGFFLNPLISVIYPIPKVAFLPIMIIWLGLGDASKMATIALSVFFPTFINAYGGARDIKQNFFWAARNMGASRWRIFRCVVLPAALPQIFAGARIGLGLAYVVLFATELFGARSGLGYLISLAENSRRFDIMYVAIIAIGIAGFISDRLLIRLRARVLRGQTIATGESVDV